MGRSKWFPALILGLVLMIVGTIAIMMTGIVGSSEPVQIHAVIENSSGNRWVQFVAGMQQAAEDCNVKLSVVPTGQFLNLEEEQVLIDRALQEGADGVIIQLCTDENAAAFLESLRSRTEIELIDTGTSDFISYIAGSVGTDNVAIGKTLAEEADLFSGKPLSEYTIAVLQGNPELSSMRQRHSGFTQELKARGGKVSWMLVKSPGSESFKDMLMNKEPPDILVALDNEGLEAAGEYAASLDKKIIVVGTGTSTKAIYYLDTGVVMSLVVPEDYMMGYQSLSDLAGYINKDRFLPLERTVEHRIIHKETLFTEENQGMLFPTQR